MYVPSVTLTSVRFCHTSDSIPLHVYLPVPSPSVCGIQFVWKGNTLVAMESEYELSLEKLSILPG